MQVATLTTTGLKGQTEVSDTLFGAKVNKRLIAQAVRVYLSNLRQGTSQTQTRSDVNRTSAKVYRQKGTGRARHGARTAPIFVGGGVAHGPTGLENWSRQLSKQMKNQALISALSAQVANVVISDQIQTLSGKTKAAATLLQPVMTSSQKVLVVVAEATPEVIRSLRNLPRVSLTRASRLNTLAVAMADKIVMSPEAITVLTNRLGIETQSVVTPKKKVAAKTPKKTVTTKKN